jgi:hypothetical protein
MRVSRRWSQSDKPGGNVTSKNEKFETRNWTDGYESGKIVTTTDRVGANATRLGWKESLQRRFGLGLLKQRIIVERA